MTYLSYGVNARVNLTSNPSMFYLFAGPRIDFDLSDDITSTLASVNNIKETLSEKMKRVGGGLSAGMGIELPAGKYYSIQLEFQYSPSLYDILKDETYTLSSNSFEFRGGIRF